MPQDPKTKTISNSDLSLVMETITKTLYKLIVGQTPGWSQFVTAANELSPMLQDIKGFKKQLAAESEQWSQSLRKLNQNELEREKDSREQRLAQFQRELDKYSVTDVTSNTAGFNAYTESLLPATHAVTFARIEQLTTDIALLNNALDQIDTTVETKETAVAEKPKQRDELSLIDVWGTMPMPEPTGTTPQSLFGGVDLGKPKLSKVSTTPPEQNTKQAQETFTELTALSESFQSSFNSGMQAVGQSINQSVGGVFKSVFGEANSLLEIFIQNFVTSMASNVLSLLTGGLSGGLLSILGFAKGGIINEPIFGIGKSGQRYLFGEAGREAVIPLGDMAKTAQFMRQYPAPFKPGSVIAETKVSGSDLLVVLKYAGMRTGRTTF